MEQQVILVNQRDEPIGAMEKSEAHQKGLLHRAFSIFIFNSNGQMLLQLRAMNKYHSGGLWTNACCSHPEPGEETGKAAARRLQEEMGFETPLKKIFDFIYESNVGNGLMEHEFDHVYTGEYNGPVYLNKDEASDSCFKDMHEIEDSLNSRPDEFTIWFRLAFPRVKKWWSEAYLHTQKGRG